MAKPRAFFSLRDGAPDPWTSPVLSHARQYRQGIARLVDAIIETAAARRKESGREPAGAAAIRSQNPLSQPTRTKRSPAPLVHAASKPVREEIYRMYGLFVAAFREAAEHLKAGDRSAWFPEGSFLPVYPSSRPGSLPSGRLQAGLLRKPKAQVISPPINFRVFAGEVCPAPGLLPRPGCPPRVWKRDFQPETVQNVAANLRKAASQRALGLSVRFGSRIAWNLFLGPEGAAMRDAVLRCLGEFSRDVRLHITCGSP